MHRAFPESLAGSFSSLSIGDRQEPYEPALNKTYTKNSGSDRLREAQEYLNLLDFPFEHWFLDHEHSASEIKRNSAKNDSIVLSQENERPDPRIELEGSFSSDTSISDDVFMPEIFRRKKPQKPSTPEEPPTRRSSADAAEEVLRRLKSYGRNKPSAPSDYFSDRLGYDEDVFDREDELDRLLRSELGYRNKLDHQREIRHPPHPRHHKKHTHHHRHHHHKKDEVEEIRKGIRDCRMGYKRSKNMAVESVKKAIDERQKSRASSAASFHSRPVSQMLLQPRRTGKSIDLIPVLKL